VFLDECDLPQEWSAGLLDRPETHGAVLVATSRPGLWATSQRQPAGRRRSRARKPDLAALRRLEHGVRRPARPWRAPRADLVVAAHIVGQRDSGRPGGRPRARSGRCRAPARPRARARAAGRGRPARTRCVAGTSMVGFQRGPRRRNAGRRQVRHAQGDDVDVRFLPPWSRPPPGSVVNETAILDRVGAPAVSTSGEFAPPPVGWRARCGWVQRIAVRGRRRTPSGAAGRPRRTWWSTSGVAPCWRAGDAGGAAQAGRRSHRAGLRWRFARRAAVCSVCRSRADRRGSCRWTRCSTGPGRGR